MPKIEHSDVEVLIDEGEVREIFAGIEKKSKAFALLTRLPNMSSNKTKIKVLESLPLVYWQDSSTSFKKITKLKWNKKYITAAELAVIIPIAEADIDDASYDLWVQIRPKLEEAVGNKIDHAVFFGTSGTDVPASFPDGIVKQAIDKGFAHQKTATETVYNAISETMGLVEEAGYTVNGLVAGPSIKKVFRGMTDTTGQLITGDEISALPRAIIDNGAWDKTKAIAMVGDLKEAVFALRQDMTYKLLTEGVIQDPETQEIVYNLAQQDMVALRVTFRFGWQLPNPVNILKPEEAGRLPFAVLTPEAGGGN